MDANGCERLDDARLSVGDKVVVSSGDGDGASGRDGVILAVYQSGRCCVGFSDNSFRNLPPHLLRRK